MEKLRYVTPRFAEIFGYRHPEDLIGTLSISDLIAPEERAPTMEILTQSPERPAEPFKTVGVRRDGSTTRLEIASAGQLAFVVDEDAELRKSVFARVSQAIAVSGSFPESLLGFTHALLGELSDWCTIDLLEDESFVRRVSHAHSGPEKLPSGAPPNHCIQEVLESAKPRIISGTDEESFVEIASALGIRSVAMLPLLSEGRPMGTLSLVRGQARRPFEEHDLPLLTEIAALAATLARAGRAFQHARSELKLRDQFLSIASHELKTPLTALQSLIQLLLLKTREGEPLSQAQSVQMLENAERQSKRMLKLINDLLDMSRMTAGRLVLKRESTDLVELVREVLERLDPQLKSAGCAVSLSAPPTITGLWDRSRLEEVAMNLLSNAMKYGRGKPIHVTLEARSTSGCVRLIVADQGVGIAARDQARIFDVFERAAHAHDSLGHGLGLYIVRQIIEAHCGTIRVESELGQGSRFICEIPQN